MNFGSHLVPSREQEAKFIFANLGSKKARIKMNRNSLYQTIFQTLVFRTSVSSSSRVVMTA
jgi:hypothetical protein